MLSHCMYCVWTVACFAKSKVIEETLCNYVFCAHIIADINECQDGNNGGCTDQCTNTHGSYQCSCRRGYEFQGEDEAPGSEVGGVINTYAGRLCQG